MTDFSNNKRRRRKLLEKGRGGGGELESGGILAREFFWDFNSLKSSFLGFHSKSFRQDIGWFHFPQMKNEEFSRFQLGKLLLLRKCIFILKNFLNDFGKTVETGLDPRLDSVYFFLLLSLSLSLFLSSSALFSSPPAF